MPQDSNDEPASILLAKIRKEREKNHKVGKKKQGIAPISDNENPFDISKSWEWVNLGYILSKITDGTHHSPPNFENGRYKYITAKNIKDHGPDLANITYVSKKDHEDIYSRCDPQKGDVLLIKDGATTGISCINSLEEPFSMLSSVALLRVNSLILNNKYLLYYLKSTIFQKIVINDMDGVAIRRITLRKINNIAIPMPPLKEQKRIVKSIESSLKVWATISEGLIIEDKNLCSLKESILNKAFEGRLVEQKESEGTGHELLEKMLATKKIEKPKKKIIREKVPKRKKRISR